MAPTTNVAPTRTAQVLVRLTPLESQILDAYAEKFGCGRAEAMRRALTALSILDGIDTAVRDGDV